VHAQREGNRARDPRAREWAAAVNPAGTAGLTVLREGWPPDRGETLGLGQRLDAQRNRPAPRSGDTPRPTGIWQTGDRMQTTPALSQPTPVQSSQRGRCSTAPLKTSLDTSIVA
jgi:hypothetical protein